MTEPQSSDTTGWTPQTLKQHFDAILDEQRRGMVVAAQEREKAASALRDELARATAEGDRALHDHIEQQLQQVQAALIAAEKLEVQRFAELTSRVEAVQREITIAFAASEKAIEKQEVTNKEWRSGANEWRQQSADRERSQAEELAKMTATFLRSDTADAQFKGLREYIDSALGELRRQISELSEKVGKLV
jgi:hypothetical protein